VTKLVILSRIGAGLSALTIIVLSVVPMRPHILGNDYCEHFIAYFVTGSLLAIGYPRPMQLLSSGVLLAVGAGSLEFVQLWIPSRTANVGGFIASAVGAGIGLLIMIVVRRVVERKRATPAP
jgi:VanZ family protein